MAAASFTGNDALFLCGMNAGWEERLLAINGAVVHGGFSGKQMRANAPLRWPISIERSSADTWLSIFVVILTYIQTHAHLPSTRCSKLIRPMRSFRVLLLYTLSLLLCLTPFIVLSFASAWSSMIHSRQVAILSCSPVFVHSLAHSPSSHFSRVELESFRDFQATNFNVDSLTAC